jgi:hypothetical protein
MNDQIMQLWYITSVCKGHRHTAIVQDTGMEKAIAQYCNAFPNRSEDMVTIKGRLLQFNRYDSFGKLVPNIAEVPG